LTNDDYFKGDVRAQTQKTNDESKKKGEIAFEPNKGEKRGKRGPERDAMREKREKIGCLVAQGQITRKT